MKKINIALKENPYQVLIGKDILPTITNEIARKKLHRNILVVIDGNVDSLHGGQIKDCFAGYPSKIKFLRLTPGEEYKSGETLEKIYSSLLSGNFGRDTLIVAVGGGVTGDIAGFAAATFMRGVEYAQMPTTLLSAVDSSVGGKTGINFMGTKNVIGAFHQPKLVLTELNFLKTLPEEELISGLGEVLKYAFLYDSSYFSFIEKNVNNILCRNEKILEEVITKCVKIKSAVVQSDEKEIGLRKILNLGHTFAHSYESILQYSIKHGAAVIVGLACAVILSGRLGLTNEKTSLKFSNFIRKFNPGFNYKGLDKEKMYEIMLHDKKNREGKIKFVLPLEIGQIAIDCEAERDDVLFTLEEVEKFF